MDFFDLDILKHDYQQNLAGHYQRELTRGEEGWGEVRDLHCVFELEKQTLLKKMMLKTVKAIELILKVNPYFGGVKVTYVQ